MKIFKEIKQVGKRFLQHINLATAKKLLDVSTDALKVVDAITPYLSKYSDKFSKIVKSDSYNNFSKGVRLTDNLINRGGVMSDKSNQVISPVIKPPRRRRDTLDAENIALNMK